jgi:hypothetical protein
MKLQSADPRSNPNQHDYWLHSALLFRLPEKLQSSRKGYKSYKLIKCTNFAQLRRLAAWELVSLWKFPNGFGVRKLLILLGAKKSCKKGLDRPEIFRKNLLRRFSICAFSEPNFEKREFKLCDWRHATRELVSLGNFPNKFVSFETSRILWASRACGGTLRGNWFHPGCAGIKWVGQKSRAKKSPAEAGLGSVVRVT